MAAVSSCWKLPPCPTEPMLAGSKMDLLLAKAEPIGDGGSASGITVRKRGKNCCRTASGERSENVCERNNSADPKVSEKGVGGGAPGTRAEVPLQPMGQAVPLQTMEIHGGADLHLQSMEGTLRWSRGMPEGGCDPVGSLCWNRLLAGHVDPRGEEPMLEQVCRQVL